LTHLQTAFLSNNDKALAALIGLGADVRKLFEEDIMIMAIQKGNR
jgi:hypothetical protein